MKKSQVFLVSLGILVLAGVAITSVIMANKVDREDRFSVNGSGTVYAKADIANISIGLRTETMETAAMATEENVSKMNEIIKAVKELGVEEKDIKTSNYSLNPIYDWTEDDGRVLQGYQVYQSVDLKIRDLASIGDIISETTQKGANQVGSINFTIDDEYELKNKAREMAIEKAKEKAEIIASQTGMKLGDIKNVIENSYTPSYDNYTNAKLQMESSDAMGGGSSPSIEAGQNEVKVEVMVTYEVE
ncbi:MAG: SIMPL domain-containing protein [Patescibacteria group bacterium]|jgi:uncharacterized protein YggE|nr:SIMPL domain-containing protein [Patescibacteria group bacterium]